MSIGLLRRLEVVVGVDDDRTDFTLCYRRIESTNLCPIPILVRQSAQAILDVIWIRSTTSPNNRGGYLVFSSIKNVILYCLAKEL